MTHFGPEIFGRLSKIVGPSNVLTAPEDLISYSFDGIVAMQAMLGCVVLVRSADEVREVLLLANDHRIPVVTRGSGTGLSGGSLPVPGCLVLCTVRMNRILETDRANLTMLVEPGVTTL